jgi:hypothetical protein
MMCILKLNYLNINFQENLELKKSKKYGTYLTFHIEQNALRFEERVHSSKQFWYSYFIPTTRVYMFQNEETDFFLAVHQLSPKQSTRRYIAAQSLSDTIHKTTTSIQWYANLLIGSDKEYSVNNVEYDDALRTNHEGKYYDDVYIFERVD